MDSSSKIYSYIASQCRVDRKEKPVRGFVTISRQAGAGGITIGEKLAAYLDKQLPGMVHWTVFDKNLVDVVVNEHKLSERILPYMKEAKISEIDDMIENLFGIHPPQSTLVKRTTETILRLARMGRVILVGRGAPIITRDIKGGIHVRLVGSFGKRKEHIKEYYKLDNKAAEIFIKNEDLGRAQYLKTYFDQNIDDPLLYDLIVNTDKVSYEDAAILIGDTVIKRIKSQETILQKIEAMTY